MTDIDRRSTLAVGFVTASLLALPKSAVAETYGSDEGKELAPGVRQVNLGKREAMVPNYKTVSMRDIVYQPGASTANPAMGNDMVCHCLEGDLMRLILGFGVLAEECAGCDHRVRWQIMA